MFRVQHLTREYWPFCSLPIAGSMKHRNNNLFCFKCVDGFLGTAGGAMYFLSYIDTPGRTQPCNESGNDANSVMLSISLQSKSRVVLQSAPREIDSSLASY